MVTSLSSPAHNLETGELGIVMECSGDGQKVRVRWNNGDCAWYWYGDCHFSGDAIVVESPPVQDSGPGISMDLNAGSADFVLDPDLDLFSRLN